MLDLGLLMYSGLLVLAFWRVACWYRCCGLWLSFLSYTSLLYLMLTASLVYSMVEFYKHVQEPLIVSVNADADLWSIGWLRPFVLGSPVAVALSLILCWFQTESHVFEIHKDVGSLKHDRAVQIIALPSVFAVMAMASMVPIYELCTGNISTEMLTIPFGIDIASRLGLDTPSGSILAQAPGKNATLAAKAGINAAETLAFSAFQQAPNGTTWEEAFSFAMWRYETCFYVGDLFEAWALYQFGLLALELIREDYQSQEASDDEAKRYAAREMLKSLSAVSSLAWLGTMAFVVVCVGQTACSLLPYFGRSLADEAGDSIAMGFQVAGFIASGVALYNVFIVERAFHERLERSSPLLKFLSVKILVSLSFFQRGVLVFLQQANKIMPDFIQKIVAYVPLVGDILNMTEVQLHLFYPALILYECFLTTLMHFWAWKASEDWYTFDSELMDERQPLLWKSAAPEQHQDALA